MRDASQGAHTSEAAGTYHLVLQRHLVFHLPFNVYELNLLACEDAPLAIQILHAFDVVLDALVACQLIQRVSRVPAVMDVAPVPPLHIELLVCVFVSWVICYRLTVPAERPPLLCANDRTEHRMYGRVSMRMVPSIRCAGDQPKCKRIAAQLLRPKLHQYSAHLCASTFSTSSSSSDVSSNAATAFFCFCFRSSSEFASGASSSVISAKASASA